MITSSPLSPEQELFSANIDRPLYKSVQVQVAAFFGGPLAATWMIAKNFRALDQPQMVRKTWLWGSLATVVYLAVILLLSNRYSVVSYAITFGLIYLARAIVRKYQGVLLEEHFGEGGRVRSGWNCFAVILLSLLALVLLMIPYLFYAVTQLESGVGRVN